LWEEQNPPHKKLAAMFTTRRVAGLCPAMGFIFLFVAGLRSKF
jgi:hypothetical protein